MAKIQNSSPKHNFRFRFSELVLILLVFLSGTLLAFSSGGFIVDFEQVGFTALTSIQKGIHTVTTTVENFVTSVQKLAKLQAENQELSEKLRNYEIVQRNNSELRKENERLKEQLDFSTSLETKNFPAQIIGRSPDNLYSAYVINKGSRNGIKKNMPVLAVQHGVTGLVGKVVSVGAGTSFVMPIYDEKCVVSARIATSRDTGLVRGQGLDSEEVLRMQYIKKRVRNELHIGDMVITSGETANYVKDIPLGRISRITEIPYDSSLNIEITPIINFSQLENVIVTDLKEVNPNFTKEKK